MTFMEEIRQQPGALRALVDAYAGGGLGAARALASMVRERKYHRYLFTGMGSSFYVGYIAGAMLRRAGIAAFAFETREFLMSGLPIVDDGTLLVVISQSGESPEVVELVRRLPGARNVATITNYEGHTLFGCGEANFPLYAGDEVTTASKTYTNTVAAVLFIAELILNPSLSFAPRFREKALGCADIMERWIGDEALSGRLSDFFHDSAFVCMVGGGASYCTASHAELVVEEAGKMFSTRYLPAQLIHGPIELIDERFHAIVLDFCEETREPVDRIIDNLMTYGGRALVIGNRGLDIQNERLMKIRADVRDACYAPLLEVVPVELMVNRLGLRRGLAPGILTRVRK